MNETWNITYEDEIDGKELRVGVSFAIHGESGKRYNYIRTVTTDAGERWVDCFGGNSRRMGARSVHHDEINPKYIKVGRVSTPGSKPPAPRKRKR